MTLVPPDRSTWPGWVEMESEPVHRKAHHNQRLELTLLQAFFNVMLREMGVREVKVLDVFSVEEDMLAALPCVSLCTTLSSC